MNTSLAVEVFRPMALALMEWQEPPCAPWERISNLDKQTNYGRDKYADPFNVQADWEEKN